MGRGLRADRVLEEEEPVGLDGLGELDRLCTLESLMSVMTELDFFAQYFSATKARLLNEAQLRAC